MNKVLIISPHADDEILGAFTYLIKSKRKEIKLLICYQGVGLGQKDKEREEIIDEVSKIYRFDYRILFKTLDSYMDTIPFRNIVDTYEDIVNKDFDEVLIPYRSSHQDHKISHDAMIAALRRNVTSNVLIYEHPFQLFFINNDFDPNFFIGFNRDIFEEKIQLLTEKYSKWLYPFDIQSIENLNKQRGLQSGNDFAESFQSLRKVEKID